MTRDSGSVETQGYQPARSREVKMLITPREMIDTSVAQLETLAAFLGEQLGEGGDGPGHVTKEMCACTEILGSIRALILRVRRKERCSTGIGLSEHSS